MSDFNAKIDILYQLCRKVQEKNRMTINFSIINYKYSRFMSVSIYYKGLAMYDISENGYQQEENFIKAKEHLERILREE